MTKRMIHIIWNAVRRAVVRVLPWVVDEDLRGDVNRVVDIAVHRVAWHSVLYGIRENVHGVAWHDLNWPVRRTVDVTMRMAVDETESATLRDPHHPGLADFLLEVKAEG
jgi:hypothetical protein